MMSNNLEDRVKSLENFVDAHLDNESEKQSLEKRVKSLEESLWALEEDGEFYRNRFEDIEFRLGKAEQRLEPLDGLS